MAGLRMWAAAICLALLTTAGHAADRKSVPPVLYWNLPTGSHIAYVHFGPAKTDKPPMIYLHGGPGAYNVEPALKNAAWNQHLAELGIEIYIYDQIGSGLSARLTDPWQYTVKRHVADLDAIREKIGARHVVLFGESWGATLAANYMATHPGVVVKAAFISPGPIDRGEPNPELKIPDEFMPFLRTSHAAAMSRYEQLDRLLRKHDIRAAHDFAPDAEMDPLLDEFVNRVVRVQTVHDPAHAGDYVMHGMGWWSYLMTNWDLTAHSASPQKKLAGNSTPVIVIRGDSDYMALPVAEEYVRTFKSAKLIRIPKAGHIIWLEQFRVLTGTLEDFLLGR